MVELERRALAAGEVQREALERNVRDPAETRDELRGRGDRAEQRQAHAAAREREAEAEAAPRADGEVDRAVERVRQQRGARARGADRRRLRARPRGVVRGGARIAEPLQVR